MKFFIIHGAYGNPNENWIPWLKSKLEKDNHTVFVPEFPTPKNQSYKNWKKVLDSYSDYINEDTSFITHSLGCAFLIKWLNETNTKIKTGIFIAPFFETLGNPEFDKINSSFVDKVNWKKVNKLIEEKICYTSEDDPYIPIKTSTDFVKKLGGNWVKYKKAGHFNSKSGFNKFPKLLEKINYLGDKKIREKNIALDQNKIQLVTVFLAIIIGFSAILNVFIPFSLENPNQFYLTIWITLLGFTIYLIFYLFITLLAYTNIIIFSKSNYVAANLILHFAPRLVLISVILLIQTALMEFIIKENQLFYPIILWGGYIIIAIILVKSLFLTKQFEEEVMY